MASAMVLSSCSQIQDRQDEPTAIPDLTIQLVKDRLPDAPNIKFTPFTPGKVWLAEAYSDSEVHDIFVSRSRILSHMRSHSHAPQDVTEVVKTLSIRNSLLARTRKGSTTGNSTTEEYQIDLILDGNRHLLTCSIQNNGTKRYQLTTHPRAYRQFTTTSFDDLPTEIQQLPVSRGDFKSATITEEGNRAVFQLSFTSAVLEVNDRLDILFSNLEAPPVAINPDDLPVAAREWLIHNPQPAELSGMVYEHFRFHNKTGFRLTFHSNHEKAYVFFDESGNFRYRYVTADLTV